MRDARMSPPVGRTAASQQHDVRPLWSECGQSLAVPCTFYPTARSLRFELAIPSTRIACAIQRLSFLNRNRPDVVTVEVANSNPTIISPLAVEIADHNLTANKSLHEELGIATYSSRGLWPIYTI